MAWQKCMYNISASVPILWKNAVNTCRCLRGNTIDERLYQYPDIKWVYVFPHGSLRPCSVIIGYSPNSLLEGETVRIGWNISVRVFFIWKEISFGWRKIWHSSCEKKNRRRSREAITQPRSSYNTSSVMMVRIYEIGYGEDVIVLYLPT